MNYSYIFLLILLYFSIIKIETINIELVKKYIGVVKLFRSIDIIKTDNQPIEIIDNVFIGSIGAAMNRKALEENKISHIIVAAQGLQEYHPEVRNKIINLKFLF